MVPLFTWQVSRKSGGKFYACSLEFDRLHNEMDAVRGWSAAQDPPGRVAAMVFWTPSDGGNGTTSSTRYCGRNSPPMTYHTWLFKAGIVPRGCPHN